VSICYSLSTESSRPAAGALGKSARRARSADRLSPDRAGTRRVSARCARCAVPGRTYNLVVVLRLAVIVCVALGSFGVGLEASRGTHALYEHWYCVTPLLVIGAGVVLAVLDFRRSHFA